MTDYSRFKFDMTPRAGYPMIYCMQDEFTARVYGKTLADAIALAEAHATGECAVNGWPS